MNNWYPIAAQCIKKEKVWKATKTNNSLKKSIKKRVEEKKKLQKILEFHFLNVRNKINKINLKNNWIVISDVADLKSAQLFILKISSTETQAKWYKVVKNYLRWMRTGKANLCHHISWFFC